MWLASRRNRLYPKPFLMWAQLTDGPDASASRRVIWPPIRAGGWALGQPRIYEYPPPPSCQSSLGSTGNGLRAGGGGGVRAPCRRGAWGGKGALVTGQSQDASLKTPMVTHHLPYEVA